MIREGHTPGAPQPNLFGWSYGFWGSSPHGHTLIGKPKNKPPMGVPIYRGLRTTKTAMVTHYRQWLAEVVTYPCWAGPGSAETGGTPEVSEREWRWIVRWVWLVLLFYPILRCFSKHFKWPLVSQVLDFLWEKAMTQEDSSKNTPININLYPSPTNPKVGCGFLWSYIVFAQ